MSNDIQCPEPEPEAESGVLVSDTILQRYMQASIHPEYFTIMLSVKKYFKRRCEIIPDSRDPGCCDPYLPAAINCLETP